MKPRATIPILALSLAVLTPFTHGQSAPLGKPLVFEAENVTTPANAWLADKDSDAKWTLWSTDRDAAKKWSGGVVLRSPIVKQDRATPEDGAPPLRTRITGIPRGRYEVTIKMGRTLAVSRDGKTWERLTDGYLGVVEVKDGTFDLWLDDRYAHAASPGAGYYDNIKFMPVPARIAKKPVRGFAKARVREPLDRGLIARPAGEGRVYVGWRLLAADPPDVAFNVYRARDGKPAAKLNAEPIRKTADFMDTTVPAGAACEYTVCAVTTKGEGKPSPVARATASAEAQACVVIKLDEGVKFQKAGIADLDGDGRYDFVIKQPEDNIDPAKSYWKPSPDTYKLEAYSHDGRRLWRKDLGWAIERGVWYSPYVVFDFDGDGRAEVAVKTGEGDPRGPDGRVETGREWISILDGRTGKERARAPWPSREIPGEGYNYNWSSRNQLCVAYLDGKTPCLIVERGTYTTIRLDAYQFHRGALRKLWSWDSREEIGRGKYNSQGAHTMHAADVDGDGRDEVIIGSAVVDDNGHGLWSTGFGHPDYIFVGDIDPQRPGLEIFYGIEPPRANNGLCLVDAKTGELIWGLQEPTGHVGSDGVCADFDPRHPGAECHANDIDRERKFRKSWVFSAKGELISDQRMGSLALTAYWDGDLYREIVRGSKLNKFDDSTVPPNIVGRVVAIADIVGDWREEIITSAPGELRIYSTIIPATDRRPCLMQDPIYRIDVAEAAQGYYCVPTLSVLPSAGAPNR